MPIKKIKDNLSRNMNNNLFIRSVDSTTESCLKYVYIEVSHIDANSYEKIENSNYFKDKQQVNYLQETLARGYIKHVAGANSNNFSLSYKKGTNDYYCK
ncbi:hypothetical protein J3U68_09060 [Snodgrassella sp. B3882]|uniref:hypothetical protein n=1 Tax=Snodgrassella sp. B3882 TaxID=2818037 RepID=UPI00226AB5EE|nr:hypothetical protein [Snodgrassella sp. B3882]MCX8745557.1 hypothetical protein [Snodgrassella sp. B3882]